MPERHHRLGPHDRVEAMKRAWAAERDALAVVRRFNAKISAKRAVWFWPKNWRGDHGAAPVGDHRLR